MKQEEILQRAISRRRLLINAAIAAGGAATITSSSIGFLSTAIAKDGPTEKWPWPYVKLDPGKT
jgi:hypothetical protein